MEKKKIDLKDIVKDRYAKIVSSSNADSCNCGCSCSDNTDYTVFKEDYSKLQGYNPDADYGLGCGLPTEFAKIKAGDTVLDLGSGAGNDCFVARAVTGENGKVIGLDFTQKMIDKANANKAKLGYSNIEFVLGDIEHMPLETETVDVVISNCVLNLVPDKTSAFKEIYRVLKNSGHFCVSDVVIIGNLPDKIKKDAEMYAACVSGAVQKDEYLKIIENTGFKNIKLVKEKKVELSDGMLSKYLSNIEIENFKKSNTGIYSITVYADKF